MSVFPFIKILNIFRKPYEMHNALGQGWAHIYIDERNLKPFMRVKFEDTVLPVPANYEVFLTDLYGDWRKQPSDEEILKTGIHSKNLI